MTNKPNYKRFYFINAPMQCILFIAPHVYHPLGYIWNMGISFNINLMVLPWQFLGQKKMQLYQVGGLEYIIYNVRSYIRKILKLLQQRQ